VGRVIFITLDIATSLLIARMEEKEYLTYGTKPFGSRTPRPIQTHYTTGAGGSYSMRPDLSRSGTLVLLTKPGVLYAPFALAAANLALIHNAPKSKQRGMAQTYSSGLTGTFGIGSSLNL